MIRLCRCGIRWVQTADDEKAGQKLCLYCRPGGPPKAKPVKEGKK